MAHPSVIDRFADDYHFLSSFYMKKLEYQGVIYKSAEHAYQAMKALKAEERQQIRLAPTAAQAKRLGRKCDSNVEQWDRSKFEIMRAILRQKFKADSVLADQLLATGTKMLIEGNDWNDQYWGMIWNPHTRSWLGSNYLGMLLMTRRAELQAHAEGWGNVIPRRVRRKVKT